MQLLYEPQHRITEFFHGGAGEILRVRAMYAKEITMQRQQGAVFSLCLTPFERLGLELLWCLEEIT